MHTGGASRPKRQVALVLIGAVAKGAFEAGALEVVASRDIEVRRIVATSSGALNGTALAAGVRARRTREAAAELVDVWRDEASLFRVIHPNLRGILQGRGISDQTKLLELLRRHVRPCTAVDPAQVEMNIVVAPIRGCEGRIGEVPTTTYSRTLTFGGEAFDSAQGLERVFEATVASAALPILFMPVELPEIGLCTDGGLVNIAPVLSALGPDGGATLDAVLVVAAAPALISASRRQYRWLHIVARQIDMIFAEWLYKDLHRARQINEILVRLDDLTARGEGSPQVAAMRAMVAPPAGRPTPILSIRPAARLPGTVFSGFTDKGIREEYLDLGRERAMAVLDDLGWT